jgi:hypothetical protein
MISNNYLSKSSDQDKNDIHQDFVDFIVKTALTHRNLDKPTTNNAEFMRIVNNVDNILDNILLQEYTNNLIDLAAINGNDIDRQKQNQAAMTNDLKYQVSQRQLIAEGSVESLQKADRLRAVYERAMNEMPVNQAKALAAYMSTGVMEGKESFQLLQITRGNIAEYREQVLKGTMTAGDLTKAYSKGVDQLTLDLGLLAQLGTTAEDFGINCIAIARRETVANAKTEAQVSIPNDPDLQSWLGRNQWFGDDIEMTNVANGLGESVRRQFPHLSGRAFLEKLDEKIVEYFPHKSLGKKAKGSAVDSTGNVRGGTTSSKKSYDNLPDDARQACDRFIKNGWIKSKQEYVDSYDWS